ncbi:aminopeptidase N [Shewanella sp. OPT22]|nr:aminopeptidase N [Shewanella sp. OPT22]
MILGCTNISLPKNLQPQSKYLTQEQAQLRSQQVSNVHYQLNYQLTGQESFRSQTTLNFEWHGGDYPLRVDLDQAHINKVTINNQRFYPDYNGDFLLFKAKLLKDGQNQIVIDFTRKHSTNGEGLNRFVDPVDHNVYLYSHFEPAAAHQMFASFDQPDIKATYQLTVTAPNDWTVISATRESNIQQQGKNKIWHFPVSPKLSTYNFSMHAGPYKIWQDNSGKYPLRLLARQSVASQIEPKAWFKYTKNGLKFYEHYFGIPYPFKKYDQILVPNFLYGAMENAAAITFAEGTFLHKSKRTESQKFILAEVILHEMAHQWFGNLVTMKWWNGLWLNESFASFMSFLAIAESTEFDYAWRNFYSESKQSAYHQDGLVTTHPIEVPVASTVNAFDNIDAITYSKGAAVLAQLRHLLGDEVFRQGVHYYLTQYSYKNATLDDFVSALGQIANRDLSTWQQQWLYKASLNSIQADYQCLNHKITYFNLLQSPTDANFPTLREQKVNIGLFKLGHKRIYQTKKVTVTYQGAKTPVDSLVGAACPDLVYPNVDDWGFVQVNLDTKSFHTAEKQLNLVEDPLLRSMLWQSLWDSVVSGKLSLSDYIGVLLVNAPMETDYTILSQLTSSMVRASDDLSKIQPSHQDYANQAQKALSQLAIRMVMSNTHDSSIQRLWFNTYIDLASDNEALAHLQQLLQGNDPLDGITSDSQALDQDTRWHIIKQLNRYGVEGSDQLIKDELKRDASDTGQKAAIAAEVIRPVASIKREWLNKIFDNKLTFSKLSIAMKNLYPSEQSLLSEATAEQRLSMLPKLNKLGPVYMRAYSSSLIPTSCDQTGINRIEQVLTDNEGISELVKRNLLEHKQAEQRCVLIKESLKP